MDSGENMHMQRWGQQRYRWRREMDTEWLGSRHAHHRRWRQNGWAVDTRITEDGDRRGKDGEVKEKENESEEKVRGGESEEKGAKKK